jgi:high-affinity Fe2+/Pb2+ permease
MQNRRKQARCILEATMEPEPQPPSSGRENMLAIALSGLVGGMFLFFLYLITLGIVGNVLGIGVLVIAVGLFHYLVWGRSMSAEVAAEREAMRRQDAQEASRAKVPADAFQDISRTQAIRKK